LHSGSNAVSAAAQLRARREPPVAWLEPRRDGRIGRRRENPAILPAVVAIAGFLAWPGVALAPVATAAAAFVAEPAVGDPSRAVAAPSGLSGNGAGPAVDMARDDDDDITFNLPDPPQPVALAPLTRNDNTTDEVLRFGPRVVQRWKVNAILRAAALTDTDPVYLMALADKESSFSPSVKAGTSSAEGMYQFIERTWLKMIREYGPRYGFEAEAAMIFLVDEKPYVLDEALRTRILGLRHDAWLSAVMAAELLKKDRQIVAPKVGRSLRPAEFYLCHFLGPEDAGKFVELLEKSPGENAAITFPSPAKANASLFFVKENYTETVTKTVGKGKKKKTIKETFLRTRIRGLTVAEVYGKFESMIKNRLVHYEPVLNYISGTM
jgi:hypothetical protein